MTVDIGNNRLKDNGVPNNQYPVVKEDDTCLHWESAGTESLTPMRECWYCKFSDFRTDIDEHRAFSTCHYSVKGHDKEGKGR